MDEHKHKEKHEHHTHHPADYHTEHKHVGKKKNYWMYSTIVLIVLLGVSLFTEFFPTEEKITKPIIAESGKAIFIVLNDKDCSNCDTSQIVDVSKQLFPNIEMKKVDVNSKEGKILVEKYNVELIPSYLFSGDVSTTDNFKKPEINGAFVQVNDMYKLMDQVTGAVVFIDSAKKAAAEIQLAEEKKKAKAKMGIGDKPQIDFFVMSYCPYGNQAEEAIEKVFQVLGDKAVFMPRYVIYSNYQGGGPQYCLDSENKYCSMHGVQELNQNLRERCVYEDFGTDEMFKFMLAMNKQCNSNNADTCWSGVAESLGLDTEKIATCENDRGLEFAEEDKELNNLLGVSGSPSIFIDGLPYNGARSPEGYLNALCAGFEDKPEGCGAVVEEIEMAPIEGGCG